MKLREIICDLFHWLFPWICNRGKQSEPPKDQDGTNTIGNNGTSTNPRSGPEPSTGPLGPQQLDNTNQSDNHNKLQNPSPTKVSNPYTIKSVPFLTSKLDWVYGTAYTVKYFISDSDNDKFPIIRAPKEGCEIKLPVVGRSCKRGVCEEHLCKMIRDLKLPDFYDDVSLFVGNYPKPYEPDIAYIDVQKGIFIDIEIDEPYSGWERLPIHYKTKYGTIDDLRNNYFTERGWTVLRFSEKQVHEQPKSCLKRVYQLLHEMDGSITMPQCLATEADIFSNDMWTKEQAERMEQNKEREKMLGIDKFIMSPERPNEALKKDYPHGQEIEEKISNRKKEAQLKEGEQIQSKFRVNPQQPPKVPITNPDEQRCREAEQYEHPQQISTQTKPKSTPSSRGYA